MAKIHSMMDVGKRSMMNSQTALQTVAHNIANKSTEGYSRQRVDQVTNPPVQEGRLQIGTGSRAAQINRVNNPFLDKQLSKESGNAAFMDAQADALGKLEQIYNEQQNKGLNQYVSEFFNAFRELSNNPESVTTRTMVKEAAVSMTQDFRRVNEQMNKVQEGIDLAVKAQIEEVNRFTKEIADLNLKIAEVEVQGIPANDQRDRRDLLIKKLHEKMDIKTADGNNGMVTVSAANNAVLVSDFSSMDLSTATDENQRTQIFYNPNNSIKPINVTERLRGGSIGGALAIRDGVVNEMKTQMDDLAYTIGTEVNKVHLQGFDRNGKAAGFFFDPMQGMDRASVNIKLNAEITDDVTRIASASKPNAPGDNTVANVMSMLQYRNIMGGGNSTIDDFYNSQVGRIGIAANRAFKQKESQDNIVGQVTKLRESVSGVSLDEEATKMIEYQKAFDASARVIRTADELFDTVLNLKRY